MNSIKVRPVRNKREKKIFLTFPWRIYKNDKLWVPPLIPERKNVINPQKGTFFKRGEAEFFIAWENGQPVGTICAAVDHKANQNVGKKDCIWGFFECEENFTIAEALWEQAIKWAGEQGMENLFGPFNLDYEDSYGILVEGRDRPPVLLCGHTPPYYLKFVKQFGFTPGRGQNLAFALEVKDTPAIKRLGRMAERARWQGRVTIRTANMQNWDKEVENVLGLLNSSLAHLEGHIPWQPEQLGAILEPFKKIADPELVLFAEIKGQVVGFFPRCIQYQRSPDPCQRTALPLELCHCLVAYAKTKPVFIHQKCAGPAGVLGNSRGCAFI